MSLASYRAAPSRGDLCDLFCDPHLELSGKTSVLSRVTLDNVCQAIPLTATGLSSNSQLNFKENGVLEPNSSEFQQVKSSIRGDLGKEGSIAGQVVVPGFG